MASCEGIGGALLKCIKVTLVFDWLESFLSLGIINVHDMYVLTTIVPRNPNNMGPSITALLFGLKNLQAKTFHPLSYAV